MTENTIMNMGPSAVLLRFTLTYADLTTSGTLMTISLKTLPKGSFVKGVRTKHSVLFSGGANNAASTVEVGSTAGGTTLFSPAFNIGQAVADTTAQMVSGWKAGTNAADVLTATFRASSDVSTLTTGSVNIDVELFLTEDLTATGPSGNSSSGGLL
jgi:hypothetical protein